MRKLLMIAVILLTGIGSVMAQKGVKAVGLNVNYGTEVKNLGFGAKFQYGLTDAVRIEPSFNYFLEKNSVSELDANVNVHYLIDVADNIKVYPLAGLGYAHCKSAAWSVDLDGDDRDDMGESYSHGEVCVNLGVGAEYPVTDNLAVNAELKYQIISNFNQLTIGLGIAYKF